MVLFDVNIPIYAHRSDSVHHAAMRPWLEAQLSGNAFGHCDLAGAAFLRIVTNHRVFSPPTRYQAAAQFVAAIRDHENCVLIAPGRRHWEIFTKLCEESGAKGNLIADAYFAALAMESGRDWVSTDGDYARFRSLKWVNPLANR